MPLTAGMRLGPYEILSAIGAGGMGEIYRARDPRLKRDVAIKVLPGPLAADESAVARFEREAKVLAALSHPNLLAIHDVGVQDRTVYAVMELLEGSSLREGWRPRPPRPAGAQSGGLRRPDRQGTGGGARKTDRPSRSQARERVRHHGRARQDPRFRLGAAAGRVWSDGATTVRATHPGTVMGTVGYMAPEQVRGETVDHRGDIFAFGCVLHEMVSGRRAFERPTPAETMTAILHEDPPRVSDPAELPAPLASIISRCLEKQPEERFQSASDLAFHLEHAHESSGTSRALPAPAPRQRRVMRIAIGALALAAAAAAGWLGRAPSPLTVAEAGAAFRAADGFPGPGTVAEPVA